MPLLLVVIVALSTLVPTNSDGICFTGEEVNCLLSDKAEDENIEGHLPPCGSDESIKRQPIILGRVRFPGTASTNELNQFQNYEADNLRYSGIAKANHCPSNNICFEAGTVGQEGASDGVITQALQQLHLTGFGSHSAYDVVESTLEKASQTQDAILGNPDHTSKYYMITTLREPGSYMHKWYSFRRTWDAFPHLQNPNITFTEWIDLAPWRMNVLTRMLGSKSDRITMPKNLIYTHSMTGNGQMDDILKDEYMTHQNDLGPEESQIYETALIRLKEMVHFGLFHRLSESWELLEHTFCWKMGYQNYRPDKEIIGFEALTKKLYFGRVPSEEEEAEAATIWKKLKRKNRLDFALLEAAEEIFDERLERMRKEKSNGILCNFLGEVEVRCEGSSS